MLSNAWRARRLGGGTSKLQNFRHAARGRGAGAGGRPATVDDDIMTSRKPLRKARNMDAMDGRAGGHEDDEDA